MMGERRATGDVRDCSFCFMNRLEKNLNKKESRQQNKEELVSEVMSKCFKGIGKMCSKNMA